MNKQFLIIIGFISLISWGIWALNVQAVAPGLPSIYGPNSWFTNKSADFSAFATDADGADQIRYLWDWEGDGIVDATSSFFDSGDSSNMSHTFTSANNYTVKVKAKDLLGEESGWSIFNVSVTVTNNLPVLEAIGSKTVSEDQELLFSVFASDPDGDTIVYSSSNLPTGASFSLAASGNYLFKWTPTIEQSGTYSVSFFVDDGNGGADSENVSITVKNIVGGNTDTTAPFVSDITVKVTENSATFNWKTNELAKGKIEYGVTDSLGSATDFTGTYGTTSQVEVTGLKPGVLYRYKVVARDEVWNTSNETIRTFVTTTEKAAEEVRTRLQITDGSLIRKVGDGKVFVIKASKRVHISSPEVFSERGYKWEDIIDVEESIFKDYAEAKILIRTSDDLTIYQVLDGKKRIIATQDTFSNLGLDMADVAIVTSSELDSYPRLKLVRIEGDERVYYITEGGLKKWIRNIDIFNSYDNKWEDVAIVSEIDLSIYPDVELIRLEGGERVYKLDGTNKRWIKTAEAFARLGYDWNKIVIINKIEFDFHAEGSVIE